MFTGSIAVSRAHPYHGSPGPPSCCQRPFALRARKGVDGRAVPDGVGDERPRRHVDQRPGRGVEGRVMTPRERPVLVRLVPHDLLDVERPPLDGDGSLEDERHARRNAQTRRPRVRLEHLPPRARGLAVERRRHAAELRVGARVREQHLPAAAILGEEVELRAPVGARLARPYRREPVVRGEPVVPRWTHEDDLAAARGLDRHLQVPRGELEHPTTLIEARERPPAASARAPP
jgi:hypothetical protein